MLAVLLSSCGAVIQTPVPIETDAKIIPTITDSAPLESTPIPPTEMATPVSTPEDILSIDSIPSELKFIDGRNIKEMSSSVGIDANTGLEVAMNQERNIVAYNLKTENKDLWVVNPLLETGFKWNFDINENGQYILHNILEENKYKPFPIEGIRYVKSDQLPATFWDESHPVREDEKHPWPDEGTLAVFDGEGDILMYYSKQENAWWFAGYQEELPGNMVFRQSSMSLALSGIRYKQVDEDIWPGSDLNVTWQEIRNHVDWLAYTHRTGNFISFEKFSSRAANGEVFKYQSWVFDLATNDYKLTTLSNKTKLYFETTISKKGFGNSYDSVFNVKLLGVGIDYRVGILLNPDDSITIINEHTDATVSSLRPKNLFFLSNQIAPFNSYTIELLAASDKFQKEGITRVHPENNEFYGISPFELNLRQANRTAVLHFSEPYIDGVEWQLRQGTPIIYPNIENPHPRQ